MSIISRVNGEHYVWGDGCDGWHLVRTADVSVIEERMPSTTSEQRHRHQRSNQFFYVLEGTLTMEVEDEVNVLGAGDGVAVTAGMAHQAMNRSAADVRFLVVSQPPSHGDRLPA